MSQWVQSKYSKDAKKWELTNRQPALLHTYAVHDHECFSQVIHLPKSEYIPCDPPERWETCTREVIKVNDWGSFNWVDKPPIGYRWAWSEKDAEALILQRRVQS